MVSYRTELDHFMLDQLDFVEHKLREALADSASQKGAIIEAAGVLPQLKERIWSENPGTAVSCLLIFPELVERAGERWWDELANKARDQFVSEATRLLKDQSSIAKVRALFKSTSGL